MTASVAIATTKSSTRWRAYAALAVGVACIGWSAIFVKWAGVPGSASAFYRAFFAFLILAPLALRSARQRAHQRAGALPRAALWLAILAGLFFAGDLAMYNSAILLTSATNATLLGNNSPVIVALVAWFLFGSRPGSIYWIGLAIAMLGTVAIVGVDIFAHPSFGLGDLLASLASVCFSGYLVAVEQVRTRARVDTLTLTTITVGVTAAACLVIALVMRTPLTGYSLSAWSSLLALGLVCQVGGYLALTYALGRLPATLTSVGLLVQAPLTALLAVPLLHESLSAAQILGGALVLGGVYLVNAAGSTPTRATSEYPVPERA